VIRAPLRLRQLGASQVFVTELSFGAAAIGNLFTEVDDETALAAVDAAWEGGIRTFDTAPHYGLGLRAAPRRGAGAPAAERVRHLHESRPPAAAG
jgi:D-threo-aldose 1-dehydrogenase